MIKRVLAAALLAVLLLSLSACGDPASVLPSSVSGTPSVSGGSSDREHVTDLSAGDETPSAPPVTMPPPYSPEAVERFDPQEILEEGTYLVGLTDQQNERLIVCDLAEEDWANDNAVVWEYRGVSAAGIKFRDCDYWDGEVVLYCGGTKAGIVSYSTGELLLETRSAPGNSHSVEILPNGVFIVVGSTSNTVRVFGAGKTEPSFSLEFTSGHGALWDPKYQVLWLEGGNLLQAYKVVGTAEDPALQAVDGMSYHPNTALHDLAPVYGNPDALFLTGASGVVIFDKITGKKSYDYPAGGYLKGQSYVPGVGNFPGDQVYVFTTIRSDTLTYMDWGSDRVEIYVSAGGIRGKVLSRQAESDAYYKARAWCPDYQ